MCDDRIPSPTSDMSGGEDESEDFALSSELLKREKEYLRRNKEIQDKSDQVVKKAELLMKEGKEHLQKPLAHYLADDETASNLQLPKNSIAPAADKSSAHDYKQIVVPKRPASAVGYARKCDSHGDLEKRQPSSSQHQADSKLSASTKRDAAAKLISAQQKLNAETSNPRQRGTSPHDNRDTAPSLAPNIDDGIGLEATNRLLKAKLVVVQEEMEKVVRNQGVKDSAIAMLEEKLKFFDEERTKISKNVQSLQAQIDKANKANAELKAKNEMLEVDRDNLKKNLEGLSKIQRAAESEANSKDLRLNRALEEIEKLKVALAKANGDAKDKIESLKKNQQSLLAETKKLAKQKSELVAVFKKQNLLIDNLKRQKLHLEAAALLDFSEEEFVRALNCRPLAGQDV
ncbi:Golgin sub A member 2 [Entophlyctis luteolus]|nr:Golgin sub A member 2 [Entophlyctis luteolus]